MSDAILSVENLSKRYRIGQIGATTLRHSVERWWCGRKESSRTETEEGEIWALKDVSFEVRRGEVVGIIGRNGAGKSTLLKLLSRITEPTSGRAVMRGRVASLLEVGTGFHPELTGRENVYLNGSILGMRHREIDLKFDEIVSFAEVEKFIDTPVKRYSSGMYVRLAFAVAAHLEPEVLLVDEVLAVGDAAFRHKCVGKMGDIAREGRTVLFVSHNMGVMRALTERALVLEEAELVDEGPTKDCIAGYLERIGVKDGDDTCFLDETRYSEELGQKAKLVSCEPLGSQESSFCREEAIRYRIGFEKYGEVNNVVFGLSVSTHEGARIASHLSKELDIGGLTVGGKAYVTVSLAGLRLRPGRYCLSLGIASGGMQLDHIPRALDFDVRVDVAECTEDDDFRPDLGPVLIDAEWVPELNSGCKER